MFIIEKANHRSITPFVTFFLILIWIFVFFTNVFRLDLFQASKEVDLHSLVTNIFFHKSFWEILINCIYFYMYGDNIEDVLGHFLFIIVLVFLSIFVNLSYVLLNWNSTLPILGASGVVSGILGMYIVFFPKVKTTLITKKFMFSDLPVVTSLIFWVPYQFIVMFWEMQANETAYVFYSHVVGFMLGFSLAHCFLFFGWRDRHKESIRFSTGNLKTVLCPSCSAPKVIPSYGRYKCSSCESEYYFDRKGSRILF
ncbi:rhomboid family intramembrane serine protease [Leptospira idonii]|uniref:Rhomboid family intramembrane serine protease n=1 Tax=Leptospira idonii TaxID=1193500 RepID=A0A4R9LWZ3_9LEPT|nr:rhomboid family intramembrane serine protease [Leptospira idonii]TGN17399.1 rhomboid family intramembrane serine protease [Leptospira idonii]